MKPKRKTAGPSHAAGVDPRVHARGIKLRRELTGGAYAKSADADLDPALVPVRELLTEWMWGKIWTRRGIDRRTRSFMNIGILMALNRPSELAVNLGIAARNGLSRAQIGEAILHAAAYCGVPAGVNSIGVARQVFKDQDQAVAAAAGSGRASRGATSSKGRARSR